MSFSAVTKKNPNPSPRDAVYKLSKIAKNGDRHKLLEQNGIKTVEDFLSFYNKSPDDLRKVWEWIINTVILLSNLFSYTISPTVPPFVLFLILLFFSF